jgi:heme/copper-type cytochrome/quinol oxidase subunit 1
MPSFNRAQRIVFSIGLGIALLALGEWMMTWGTHFDSGWTGYAPLSSATYIPSVGGLHVWVRVVIWLFLIAFWIVVSAFLLRTRRSGASGPHD